MIRENRLKKNFKNKKLQIGTWSSIPILNIIDVLGTTNLDFVIIDMEHGSVSYETLEGMVRAAYSTSITPIVRLSSSSENEILRVLETGVQSIMIPHINSVEKAKTVSEYCKYRPLGKRGLSPYTFSHKYTHQNLDKSLQNNNKENFLGILVEGKEGLDNLEEICKVPNIDVIYLGLFDISQSLQLPADLNNKKIINELVRCEKIISKNNKIAGSMAKDIKYIKLLRKLNYKFIAYANDAYAIKMFYENSLSKI